MKPLNGPKHGTEWRKTEIWEQSISSHFNPPKEGRKEGRNKQNNLETWLPGQGSLPTCKPVTTLHVTACRAGTAHRLTAVSLPSSAPYASNLMHKEHGLCCSSRPPPCSQKCCPWVWNVPLPPSDLKLSNACSPLHYIDPGPYPELPNWESWAET